MFYEGASLLASNVSHQQRRRHTAAAERRPTLRFTVVRAKRCSRFLWKETKSWEASRCHVNVT